jgi:hypothetical protein
MFAELKRADAPARGGSYPAIEPIPGFFARRKRDLPSAEDVLARIPSGAAVDARKSA